MQAREERRGEKREWKAPVVRDVGERVALWPPKWMRRKKVEVEGSENCWDSRMLREWDRRRPVTVWTMPGRSGQESVS